MYASGLARSTCTGPTRRTASPRGRSRARTAPGRRRRRVAKRERRAEHLHGFDGITDAVPTLRCSTTSTATCPRSRRCSRTPATPAPIGSCSAATTRCSGRCPAETVAALRALPDATWIRGNVDRWTAIPEQAPDDELLQGAIAACREALGAEIVGELGALPEQVVLDGTRYCHASPHLRSALVHAGADRGRASELLGGAGERRLVFGHTHLPVPPHPRRRHRAAQSGQRRDAVRRRRARRVRARPRRRLGRAPPRGLRPRGERAAASRSGSATSPGRSAARRRLRSAPEF